MRSKARKTSKTQTVENLPGNIEFVKSAHSLSLDDVFQKLDTNSSKGLDNNEVVARTSLYGLNSLKEKSKRPTILKFLDQFKNFMVIILIIASIVSGVLGEWVDAIVIIAIVIINSLLGVIQEGKAEKAIEALKKMSSPSAKVVRDGKLEIVSSSEVVPGDICVIEAGDIVPADMRLIESSSLKIEEASLTGESVPVEKDSSIEIDRLASLGDRFNMCYMNTAVTYGRGRGVVIATGRMTEIGKIAEKLKDMKEDDTPLQKDLNKLGRILGAICLVVSAIVFINGILMGGILGEVFLTAISLAVAAIPEGLPAVVTIVLALGMKRLADKNAIMKQLLAVETLGSVDVICSDKTGTLTQNEMTVTVAWVYDRRFEISGIGYETKGEVSFNGDVLKASHIGSNAEDRLFQIGVLCTDAVIKSDTETVALIGDPTEGAIIVAGIKAGFNVSKFKADYVRKAELPFDSTRKMMTTFHADPFDSKVSIAYTKGAPDIVLSNCTNIVTDDGIISLTEDIRKKVILANSSFAGNALRVIAFAFKTESNLSIPEAETDMTFAGLMGMIDPERPEAKNAIAICKGAGIRACMITGDYKDTAVAIAKNLGLASEDDIAITGAELDLATDAEMREIVEHTSVYARVSPEHKVRIVTALGQNGHITAMTGDGVNDAMALKKSDIGVAMGITGTEVAKNTANMILTDDNFATIVAAVEEGRNIYANIRKFVGFLLSCNVGEILVIFITSILLGPKFVPLLPIQLLWLNLVTDSFPALALGREKGEPGIMLEKPRDKKENIINKRMLLTIAFQSVAIFGIVFSAFKIGIFMYPNLENISEPSAHARTFAFVTLICAELFRAFASRSENISVFRIGLFSNKFLNIAVLVSLTLLLLVVYIPFMHSIFKTTSLGVIDWLIVGSLSLIPFIVGELLKFVLAHRRKKRI